MDSDSNLFLEQAQTLCKNASSWALTDGKAGDLAQCLGVAERLALSPHIRQVSPAAPFTWLMPFGPIDFRERSTRASSPIRPPFPDILIASGRRAVAYARAVKRLSREKTFTVFLKNPRATHNVFDFIWAPEHDNLHGDNVFSTLTSPHRLTQESLSQTAATSRFSSVKKPIALLLGGNSRHHAFTDEDVQKLLEIIKHFSSQGFSILATASRRTPQEFQDAIRKTIASTQGFFWDGTGENPYRAMLAVAEHVIVTTDSVNMIGEAVSTGKPVWVFSITGFHYRKEGFLQRLFEKGAIRRLSTTLSPFSYAPIDSTPAIAIELAKRYALFRHALIDHRAS